MNNKEEFKILTPREHVRTRIGMYAGSSSLEKIDQFITGEYKTVSYVPALVKIISEILDNSLDEAIRTDFKFANKIDFSFKDDTISITDNGRGIPQDTVIDTNGEKLIRPVAAWTRVNSGTSFTEERVSIGANGVGSACTNFLSKEFIGQTWQNGNMITVKCSDGGLNVEIKNKTKDGNGTKVSFVPDFDLFEQKTLNEYDTIDIVKDRILNMSIAFPKIHFTFNGKKIENVSSFNDYSKLFGIKEASRYVFNSEDLSFFITSSEDGFRQNCYINGVNTRLGGSYVDYITNNIVDELITMIKRKYKVTPHKSTIKNGMTFVMFAKNFVNPKYDSQTKERLTNSAGQVKNHFENNFKYDFNYIAKKLMAFDDFIKPLVEAQIAKMEADEVRDAAIKQKELKRIKIAKHIPASEPENATLILTEGDSAGSSIIVVRNPKTIGMLPLRGVIKNVWGQKPKAALDNKELCELAAVMGLNFSDPESYKNRTYKNVGILTDSDVDGGKILSLIVAFFANYFPKMITEEKCIHIYRSPLIIAKKGKEEKWFYNLEEAKDIKNEGGWDIRYNKGLGSLTEDEYRKVLNTPIIDVVTMDDGIENLELMFGEDSDIRKEFMMK